jgi:plasmid stability protein
MELERRITVRTTEEFHKAVRVKAAELGRPMSDIVRDLLTMWVAGEVELPPPKGKQS